jgi:hypothetical protein
MNKIILATTAGKAVSSETARDVSRYRLPSSVTLDTETLIRYRAAAKEDTRGVEIAGTRHFNDLRRFAELESSAHHKTGKHVIVSYRHQDPDIAVLEPGNSSAALSMPGIGVVVVPALGKPVGA